MTLASASSVPGYGIADAARRLGGLGRVTAVLFGRRVLGAMALAAANTRRLATKPLTSKALALKSGTACASSRSPDLAGADRAVTMAAAPLSKSEQWQRVVRPLETASRHAQAMGELHDAAGRQLCSVDYALTQLMDDLSTIMTVPRTPRASVHELRPLGPVRFSDGDRLGASMAA